MEPSESIGPEFARTVLEATADGIVVVDAAEGTVLTCNRAAEELLHRSRHELTGHLFGLPADAGERPEIEIVRPEGDRRTVELRSSETTMDGRRVLVVSLRDITDRVEARAALEESEQHLRDLLRALTEGVWAGDEEGRTTYVNEPLARMLGHSPADMLGVHFFDFVHDDDRDRLGWILEKHRQGEPVERLELRLRDRSGSTVHTVVTTTLLTDADGAFEGVIAGLRDLTGQRRAERALREKEEEFRQAQKMEAVGRLAGGVAHDFNNMLAAVLGYVELIEAELPREDPVRTDVEKIRSAARRATDLTGQLLAFGRRQRLDPVPADLGEEVRSMSALMSRVLGERIELRLDLAEDLPLVIVDPNRIRHALINLLVNARDAMPDGGSVVVTTEAVRDGPEDPGSVRLTVRDDGPGMPEDVRRKIFDPFFTTRGEEATGLGLSTVHGLVKQSGGEITCESEVGAGTTFEIVFPAEPGVPDEEQAGAMEEDDPLEGAGETVLVVDDEDILRQLVARMLGRAGYRVRSALGAEQALELARSGEEEIDLLVTDVVMPGVHGPDLVAELRETTPELRVLYMSGYSEEEIARNHGDHPRPLLSKPFTFEELTRAVRRALSRPPGPRRSNTSPRS